MNLSVIKKMLVENSKNDMSPLHFEHLTSKKNTNDKNSGINIFKILHWIKNVWNPDIKKSEFLLKFSSTNQLFCEITYKEFSNSLDTKSENIEIKHDLPASNYWIGYSIGRLIDCLHFFIKGLVKKTLILAN